LRVLALDYGSARCGCAISDPTGSLVRPLDPLEPPNPGAVARLVEGEQAKLCGAFADELTELLDVPVRTYDERMTTRMAERSAREGATAHPDSLAAAHLLESYLEATRAGNG
jgi:putative Holliday junction resolvase